MSEAQSGFDPQVQPAPTCPQAYVNGFGIGYSKTECGILFMLNQEPTIQILIPFAVAAALADNLKMAISNYEAATNLKVPDIASVPSVIPQIAKSK